ncbi:hypothetical protein KZ804_03595 [Enterobacter cloacae]|uniref:hypothetical protein n=1 Tax=Enterobacter cloacae complex TaxID=354276 RepID=UPI000FDBEF08|nr:hypothetical protein [Enterobacter cloacae]ELE9710575.1 hypothetical protein [Enterobacter kobei]HDK7243520.1 hypothetical protein [Cronobacter sakazakii]ELV2789560.1 hypothetical protein [Enterobacter kobei]MCC1991213.1 hypothetical protein [Enterobacter cloacae]MCC2009400.1 hypothetical protein [Enterobacter cloacae]
MLSNDVTVVLVHDYLAQSPDNSYQGKYTVGRFHLTDAFIVQYMKLLHGVEIPDSWISSSFTNISDTDTRKVMYMEGCDMLSKDTMNEIRNAVKSPPDKLKIYRNGERIVKIEVMEKQNDLKI